MCYSVRGQRIHARMSGRGAVYSAMQRGGPATWLRSTAAVPQQLCRGLLLPLRRPLSGPVARGSVCGQSWRASPTILTVQSPLPDLAFPGSSIAEPWWHVIAGTTAGFAGYRLARVYDDTTDTINKQYASAAALPMWMYSQLSPQELGTWGRARGELRRTG
jgi:hypothetical protein